MKGTKRGDDEETHQKTQKKKRKKRRRTPKMATIRGSASTATALFAFRSFVKQPTQIFLSIPRNLHRNKSNFFVSHPLHRGYINPHTPQNTLTGITKSLFLSFFNVMYFLGFFPMGNLTSFLTVLCIET